MDASSLNENDAKAILELLKSGDEHIHLAEGRDVVLILGMTGSGKSTLSQVVAGELEDLSSAEVGEDSGEFIIVDKEKKISEESTILSKTIYPELYVTRESGVWLYDCPGFGDTRSSAHDISTSYFIKKVIDSARSVKLIFLVNHSSVRKGVDRKDFLNLLRHATTLLNNIDKYSISLALVVTKVENTYRREKMTMSLVPDENVINSIVDYLNNVKKDLIDLSNASVRTNDSKDFYLNALKLIDAFIGSDGGAPRKIGIFRRPNQAGPLQESDIFREGRLALEKLIFNETSYVKKKSNDFDYTISSESMNYAQDLAHEINKSLAAAIHQAGFEIMEYIVRDERNVKDLVKLGEKFKALLKYLNKFGFFPSILKDLQALNLSISNELFHNIKSYDDYLTFLELVSNKELKEPIEWIRGLQDLSEYIVNSNKWYTFLNILKTSLSSYEVQINRSRFNVSEVMKECESIDEKQVQLRGLESLITEIKQLTSGNEIIHELYNESKHILLHSVKLVSLKNLLNWSFLGNQETLCEAPNKLVVKGKFVFLSQVDASKCVGKVRFIEISASDRVYIDSNYIGVGEEVQFSLIGPVWEVIGEIKEVVLDGREGGSRTKAWNGYGHGTRGEDGLMGGAGGAAGNFLGIADQVFGGELRISVQGGRGGKGGDGGDGASGRPGRDPPLARQEVVRPPFNGYRPNDAWDEGGFKWWFPYRKNIVIVGWYQYIVEGSKATRGGDGGDGGRGGLGGHSGKAILSSTHNEDKVHKSVFPGQKGEAGVGGKAGNGAPNGKRLAASCRAIRPIVMIVTTCVNDPLIYNGRSPSGNNGTSDRNGYPLEQPSAPVEFNRPAFTINKYKLFLRDILDEHPGASSIAEFMLRMEKREEISALYDSLGLVDELLGLENQFVSLKNKGLELKPFYTSLLDRIEEYSGNPRPGEATPEYRMILAYLYTATLSKIITIKNKYTNDLIIDLPNYFESVKTKLEHLGSLEKSTAIGNRVADYKKDIEEQIKKALNRIELGIKPELNSFFHKLNAVINRTLNEMEILVEGLHEEKQELLLKREEFEDSMILKLLEVPLGFISGFLEIATPLIEEITKLATNISQVLPTLSFSGDGIDKGMGFGLAALSKVIEKSIDEISNHSNDVRRLFDVQMEDVFSILRDHTVSDESESLKNINKTVEETRAVLKQKADEVIFDPLVVSRMRNDLIESIDNTTFGKGHEAVKNTLLTILTLADLSVEQYSRIKGDENSMEYFADALESLNDRMTTLKKFEANIYKIIIPKCQFLKNLLMNSDIYSDPEKGITISWDLQDTIRDIKFEIQQVVEGALLGEELIRVFEKLDETLTIIINLYLRVQDLTDQGKLAAYIANVNSPNALRIRVEKVELREAMNKLELSLMSNEILHYHEKAMESFLQSVFPFAGEFLQELYLPPDFNLATDLDTLKTIAIGHLTALKEKLTESYVTIKHYDMFIHRDIPFTGSTIQLSPFYIWKNDENQLTITKLLRGLPVELKADIKAAPLDKDAIKFNIVGLNFKTHNNSLQTELNTKLEQYEVSMIHHGYSSYRCGDTFYTISSKEQTFRYHIYKDTKGEPIDKNLVYDKIRSSESLLSPYGMWTIQLVQPEMNYRPLAKFLEERIDLELVGRGQYVEKGALPSQVCNVQLENYYLKDESLSKIPMFYDYFEGESETVEVNRIRRDISIEYVHSGACSLHRSSTVPAIINLLMGGISSQSIQYFRRIKNWFTESNKPRQFMDLPSHGTFDHNCDASTDRISSTYSSMTTELSPSGSWGDLLLWNLLVRKLGKVREKSRARIILQDADFPNHDLAYSYYAREKCVHHTPVKGVSDFQTTDCNPITAIDHLSGFNKMSHQHPQIHSYNHETPLLN